MLVVNQSAEKEATYDGAGAILNERIAPMGAVPLFYFPIVALFANDLAAGAVAAGASVINLRLNTSAKDSFLRSQLGFTADNPAILARIYAIRVTVTTDTTSRAPPAEFTLSKMAEDLCYQGGPTGQVKQCSIGERLGSTWPGHAVAADGAAAPVVVDRATRVSRWFPIPFGGDVVNLQTQVLQLIALQGFTAEACRIHVEVAGEFANTTAIDWQRTPCVPDLDGAKAFVARFRNLFPAIFRECYAV